MWSLPIERKIQAHQSYTLSRKKQELPHIRSLTHHPVFHMHAPAKKGMDCLISSTVLRSKDGRIQGYQGIIQDVTDFNRVVKALRNSARLYLAIVEDQTESICRTLPRGKLTLARYVFVCGAP